jgi:hypothetical protein
MMRRRKRRRRKKRRRKRRKWKGKILRQTLMHKNVISMAQ